MANRNGENSVDLFSNTQANGQGQNLQPVLDTDGILKVKPTNTSGTTFNPATSEKQDDIITGLEGIAGLVTLAYDYIDLAYVASGNGVGEIETVTYKTGGSSGTTVATITLAYNASNEISSVTKT